MRAFLFMALSLLLFTNDNAQNPYSDIFATEDLLELKPNITSADLSSIEESGLKELAEQLLNDNYDQDNRFGTYQSYLQPRILAKKLKTSFYSQYENPTGIYFEKGDIAKVYVQKPEDARISLQVTNWDDKHTMQKRYPLENGYNEFIIDNKGNSYISYFTRNEDTTEDVRIHMLSGHINGVFDINKHNNSDWNQLLSDAHGPVVDILGNKVHLAYAVESLKEHSDGKGLELIELYDEFIEIQHEIMGLKKNGNVPKNHMFGRVIWEGFMHADGIGAAFHNNTMKELANAEELKQNPWGVAHEFGHVNQVRPNMKWVGTTEVTNNIYSVWTQYLYNKEQPKLEYEKLKDYDEPKIGGRITSYMESAFVHKQPYLTQAGPDRWDRERPRDWGGDHFVKLVPLWQLQLYFAVAGEGNKWENKDFYADVFTKAIEASAQQKDDAYYQLEFVKNAMDAAELNLFDFFEKSGLLLPIDLLVDDYSVAQMTITEEDIANIKDYASQYPKPTTPVLHYITANSVDIYKKKQKLKGKKGKGLEQKEGKLIIDNSAWKGAVAFETYADGQLIKVAFRGAGDENGQKTTVHLPENTTTVKAVGWDGKRKTVQ